MSFSNQTFITFIRLVNFAVPQEDNNNLPQSFEHVHEKTNNLGSDQVQHKLGCTVTEDRWRLEILDFGKERKCTIHAAKTKALISFAVTAKLICAFVFAYADCWFSSAVAHLTYRDNTQRNNDHVSKRSPETYYILHAIVHNPESTLGRGITNHILSIMAFAHVCIISLIK